MQPAHAPHTRAEHFPSNAAGRVCIAVASAAKVLPATQQALIQYMQQFAGPGLSSLVPPPEQPNPLHTPANASDSPAPAAAASERSSSSEATDGPTADVLAAVSRRQKIPHRHPIILIPPLAGVLLERKLDHRWAIREEPHVDITPSSCSGSW